MVKEWSFRQDICINSTRFMYQLFQDSMAICRYYSHPDLFITFTANPQWKEVKDALLPGQEYTDRPDLMARVFQLKKEAFLRDLTVEGVVGKVVAHVHTIEFQKRGLPHMHLLVFLDPQDRIKRAEDIDCLIRADIPDPVTETALYNIVTMVMLHGPCDSRCQGPAGKCTKGFPKPFRETTSIVENGYPQLKRPNNNRTHEKNNHVYDNTAVVPYCPYFSLKYNAHINCEACFSIKAVKYIHKYIYKGHDRTTMVLGQGNEVQQYLDSRYIAAPESVWRILGFNVHNEEPTVYRLPIHLEYEQTVTFNEEGVNLERTLYRAVNTQLTRYFEANGDPVLGETARNLLYHEFPEKFVWVDKDRRWKIRERGYAIGRMYAAPPNSGERFYLRLLLTKVKGATSFEHLRTVSGEVYATHKLACLRLGLLEDDSEWHQCLKEGAELETGVCSFK